MNEPLNICLPCRLCCDGTLIGLVQLGNEELSALRELMDIEESNCTGFFLQPCEHYCGGCNIYSQRPKQCASFKCGLLKSMEQMELDFDSAIEVISLVKQKKIAIEKKVTTLQIELKCKSFYFKIIELKKLLQKNKPESSLAQNHLDLIPDLKQLDELLLKNFGLSLD